MMVMTYLVQIILVTVVVVLFRWYWLDGKKLKKFKRSQRQGPTYYRNG